MFMRKGTLPNVVTWKVQIYLKLWSFKKSPKIFFLVDHINAFGKKKKVIGTNLIKILVTKLPKV